MATEYTAIGIDVSEMNGDIDWSQVASDSQGISFAVIRSTYGRYSDDAKAAQNVVNAKLNGIPRGLYAYSYVNVSYAGTVENAILEAKNAIDFANEYCPDLEMPIFWDFEEQDAITNSTKVQVRAWAEAFCKAVSDAGYKPGMYYTFSVNNTFLGDDFWTAHPEITRWVAYPEPSATITGGHHYWQCSWTGSVDGISTDVDMNKRLLMPLPDPVEPEPDTDPVEPKPEPEPEPEPEIDPTLPPDVLYSNRGIEYVEVRNADRELIGIIDNAESIIWETEYYGPGKFEIYVNATPQTLSVLVDGNYITRPNDMNIGIIEGLNVAWSTISGRMIAASGRFAKSLLDRRLIYRLSEYSLSPSVLRGNVEKAVRSLVYDNIVRPTDMKRAIQFVGLGTLNNIPAEIVTETGNDGQVQTTFSNLLVYTDSFLQSYSLGAYMSFGSKSKKLLYNIYEGKDRSIGNPAGNEPIIFSQDFDNLLSSEYKYDSTALKTTALIGGEGEGIDRFCVMIGTDVSGIDRREVFVDGSRISQKYKEETKNENGEIVEGEKTYPDEVYADMLKGQGNQDVAGLKIVQIFSGEVDADYTNKRWGIDYWVGDIVTVQDVQLSTHINARILKATEVQDGNGYKLKISYGA